MSRLRTRVGDVVLAALGWVLYPFVWLAVAIDRRPRPQCPDCVLALNHPGKHGPTRDAYSAISSDPDGTIPTPTIDVECVGPFPPAASSFATWRGTVRFRDTTGGGLYVLQPDGRWVSAFGTEWTP